MMSFRLSPLRSAWLARIVGALALIALAVAAAGDRMTDRHVDAAATGIVLAGLSGPPAAQAAPVVAEQAWIGMAPAPQEGAVAAGTGSGRPDAPIVGVDRCWAVDPASDHSNPAPELARPAAWSDRMTAVAERVPPAPDLPGLLRPPTA
jgi:hypothetical protein